MRIAVCDGNSIQRDLLTEMIRGALVRLGVAYQLHEYRRARDLLFDVQDGDSVDIAFVDMAAEDAWEMVLGLRAYGFDGYLVLMSDCGERVVDGYSVEADGYLTKPFCEARVCEVLTRLHDRIQTSCLTVDCRARIVRVPHTDIVYIESQNAKCVIHRSDSTVYSVYAQLDDLEEALGDRRFLRCHQSYLVNMDHVVAADTQFEMSNGDKVSIRQRERKRLRDRYRAYVCHEE